MTPATRAGGRDGGGTAIAAVAVGAVALLARAPGVLRDAFWQDEVSSARILTASSPYHALRQVARLEATPPLWYLLGWLANALGAGPVSYRWLSALAGAAAAGLTVVFARRLLPLWASAFAGLLTALGWELVMHGRELRAYALFGLLAVLFPLALVRAARSTSRLPEAALAFVVAAGTMTNYFFGLTVAAGAVWVWSEPSVRRDRRRLSVWIGAGLVPLLAWSPALVHQYRADRFTWIGPFRFDRLVETPWLLFVHHGRGGEAAALLFGLALAAGLAVLARSSEGRLCALLVALPFVFAALAWVAGAHVFISRNLVGIAPFAAVALAALVALLPRPVALAVGVAAVAAVAFGTARAEWTEPTRYDAIASALAAGGWTPRDPIVLFGDFFSFRSPLEWYLPGRPPLGLGMPAGGRCTAVYAVVAGPRNRARIDGSGLLAAAKTVGKVEVGRLRTQRVPPLEGSTVVASAAAGPCVRVVPESAILAHLSGANA